jgi:hypothetical protein
MMMTSAEALVVVARCEAQLRWVERELTARPGSASWERKRSYWSSKADAAREALASIRTREARRAVP